MPTALAKKPDESDLVNQAPKAVIFYREFSADTEEDTGWEIRLYVSSTVPSKKHNLERLRTGMVFVQGTSQRPAEESIRWAGIAVENYALIRHELCKKLPSGTWLEKRAYSFDMSEMRKVLECAFHSEKSEAD